jgi:hypothetical protein
MPSEDLIQLDLSVTDGFAFYALDSQFNRPLIVDDDADPLVNLMLTLPSKQLYKTLDFAFIKLRKKGYE